MPSPPSTGVGRSRRQSVRALDGILIEEDGDELQGAGRPSEIRR